MQIRKTQSLKDIPSNKTQPLHSHPHPHSPKPSHYIRSRISASETTHTRIRHHHPSSSLPPTTLLLSSPRIQLPIRTILFHSHLSSPLSHLNSSAPHIVITSISHSTFQSIQSPLPPFSPSPTLILTSCNTHPPTLPQPWLPSKSRR